MVWSLMARQNIGKKQRDGEEEANTSFTAQIQSTYTFIHSRTKQWNAEKTVSFFLLLFVTVTVPIIIVSSNTQILFSYMHTMEW